MLDISDLKDYIIDGCEFDIYDIDNDSTIAEGLDDAELQDWHESHNYELCTFEPTQRKDENGNVVFGITFNLCDIEDL